MSSCERNRAEHANRLIKRIVLSIVFCLPGGIMASTGYYVFSGMVVSVAGGIIGICLVLLSAWEAIE